MWTLEPNIWSWGPQTAFITFFFCAVIKYHDWMYFMEERVYSELQFITGSEEDSTMVGGGGGSMVGRGNREITSLSTHRQC